MKSLIITAAMLTLSSTAFASHRDHAEYRTAQQLVQSLNDLSRATSDEEYRAQRQGDRRAAHEWGTIATAAQRLASGVQYDVLYALDGRGNTRGVLRSFQNLEWEHRRLQQDLRRIRYLPRRVENVSTRVERLWFRLDGELRRCGGGIGPGPGPGPGPWPNPNPGRDFYVCTASDQGWEEHWGGHEGRGRDRFSAERNAIIQCQRHHGSCRVTSCDIRR